MGPRRVAASRRHVVRLAWMSLLLSGCSLCNPSLANGTSLFLQITFDPGITTPDQVRITVAGNGTTVVDKQLLPANASGPLSQPQSIRVLLPNSLAGVDTQVTVEGLQASSVVAADGTHVKPILGQEIDVNLVLGQVRVACKGIFQAFQSGFENCLGGAPQGWSAYLPVDKACSRIEESVAFGQEDFDASKVQECTQTYTAGDCTTLAQVFILAALGEFDLYRAPCAAFVPRVSTGGACSLDWDCVGGWCDTHQNCPGVCTNLIPLGGGCQGGDRCVPGAFCNSAARCVAPGVEGQSCGSDTPCEPSQFYCSGGICAAKKTSGACSDSSGCALKYTCANSVCTPNSLNGQACQAVLLSYDTCELFTSCGAADKKCHLWPSSGPCFAICLAECCSGGTCSNCPADNSCNSSALGLFDCQPLSYCARTNTCRPYICGS